MADPTQYKSLPWSRCWKHGQRYCAFISQRSLRFSARRVDAWHPNASFNVVAYYDWWPATWRSDIEVLEFDILANSIRVGAAGQRCDGTTILARGVSSEVLKQNIGDVDLRWVSRAGGCVDLLRISDRSCTEDK